MKDKTVWQDRLLAILIALAVLAGIALAVAAYTNPGTKAVSPAINSFFVLRPDSVAEEAISDYAGIRRTYTFDLSKYPLSGGRGRSLYVYLRHTYAVLDLDGTVYADTGEYPKTSHIGHTPGNYWLTLPIYADYAERSMTVTLTPAYESVRDETPTFYLIDRQPLLTMLLVPKEAAMAALGLVAVAAGIFLMLLSLSLGLESGDRQRAFFLGAVTLAAGLWKLSGLSSVPLVLDYSGRQKAIWFIGALSYLMMMVLSLRLLTVLRPDGNKRLGKVCCCFAVATALLLMLLQALNIVELHDVLLWYGIGMASLHLIALLGEKPGKQELFWLLPTFLAMGADLLIYLRTGSMSAAPVYLIWIVLNLFVRGFGFLREAIGRERLLRKKDEELREAQLQTLVNQIRPHFIYNTLATVHVFCRDDPAQAMQLIEHFNDYLHANFTAITAKEPVPFEEELKHTKAYLAVEAALYLDELSVEYRTDFVQFRLPPLSLQPIVENSVKHGIAKTHQPEHICIRSRRTEGGYEIAVEDDGPGFPAGEGESEGHVGLQNVRERLALLCGGTLTVTPRAGGGTVVTVLIPAEAKPRQSTEKRDRQERESAI